MKVYITVGLPASGKSTWARQYQKEHEDTLILNRDSLRLMLGGKWTPKYEEIVKNIEMYALVTCLQLQKKGTVIVDDTNLNPTTLNSLLKICREQEAEAEIKSFLHVSPLECIERDSHRENPVGEATIRRMSEQASKIRNILHL